MNAIDVHAVICATVVHAYVNYYEPTYRVMQLFDNSPVDLVDGLWVDDENPLLFHTGIHAFEINQVAADLSLSEWYEFFEGVYSDAESQLGGLLTPEYMREKCIEYEELRAKYPDSTICALLDSLEENYQCYLQTYWHSAVHMIS